MPLLNQIACSNHLRHGLKEARPDGFCKIAYVLQEVRPWSPPSLAEVVEVVAMNDKQRFEFGWFDDIGLVLRACQGHSFKVNDALVFQLVTEYEIPFCWHGSYQRCRQSILNQGLKAMHRQHIHLSAYPPGDQRVVSGARPDSDLFLQVDVAKARRAGIIFWRSSNGVILTRGVSGTLPLEFLREWIFSASGAGRLVEW